MKEITVSLGNDENELLVFGDRPLNRPYTQYTYGKYEYLMADDLLHAWMQEFNIEYFLREEETKDSWEYIVVFNKIEDAILFKLTWGGK